MYYAGFRKDDAHGWVEIYRKSENYVYATVFIRRMCYNKKIMD
jgi:hypothetical protein